MTPTYEELLTGSTTWKETHRNVAITISHHGHRTGREYEGAEPKPGTWCFYLIITEQMFPHRWSDFAAIPFETDFGLYHNAPAAFDDLPFHGGITWTSPEDYIDRRTRRKWGAIKVGCDYDHAWDRDDGYPDTLSSVRMDARRCADAFLEANPDIYGCCDYSGRWDEASKFYTAINGRHVHVETKIPENMPSWLPAAALKTGDAP